MTRVVHVITTLRVGGAEWLLVDVARAQRAQGLTVDVVELGSPGSLRGHLTSAGVAVHGVPLTGQSDVASATWRLVRLLRRLAPDAVHTWMFHANVLGGVAARAARVPQVVWSLHVTARQREAGALPGVRPSRRLAPCLARLTADTVLCTSEAARGDAFAAGYPSRRLQVVPNAVPLRAVDRAAAASVRAELGVAAEAPLVGHFARFVPEKDHATFLAAFGQLATSHPDVHAVLCGSGVDWDAPELVELVQANDVAERVHLLGARHDVTRLQAAADVVVLSSSWRESAPLVLLESMAQETPAVTTDVGDCAAIVGETGVVVPPHRPEALAHAMGSVLDESPSRRRERGQEARHRVVETFGFDRMLADYQQLYDGQEPIREGWL